VGGSEGGVWQKTIKNTVPFLGTLPLAKTGALYVNFSLSPTRQESHVTALHTTHAT